MAQSRYPTEPQWGAVRDEIETMYLVLNLTVKDIQKRLEAQDFSATVRQYKTRIQNWGLTKKRIDGETWKAMYLVLAERGRQCRFLVPIRDGRQTKTITAELIVKAYKRVERSKRGARTPVNDVRTAYQKLDRCDIKVVDGKAACSETCTSIALTTSSADESVFSFDDASSLTGAQTPELETSSSTLAASATSATSSPSFLSVELVDTPAAATYPHPDLLRWAPDHNFPRNRYPWAFGHGDWDYHLACEDALLLVGPSHLTTPNILAQSPSLETFWSDMAHVVSLHGFGRESLRRWEQFLDLSVATAANRPCGQENILATQWIMYYLQIFVDETVLLDSSDHPERRRARTVFERMACSSNSLILLYLNWAIELLGANDRITVLKALLEDCCTVIDNLPLQNRALYGPSFRTALRVHGSSPGGTSTSIAGFDGAFRTVGTQTNGKEYNLLLLRCHESWSLMEERRFQDAHDPVLWCVTVATRMLGTTHSVTVHCLAMLSRVTDEMGHLAVATGCLERALSALRSTHRPLQGGYFRLIVRLAALQRQAGRYEQAEQHLREATEFRKVHFGMQSATTWEAIDNLCSVIRQQGRSEEATALAESMKGEFHQAVGRARNAQRQLQAPEVCTVCTERHGQSRPCRPLMLEIGVVCLDSNVDAYC